MKVYIGPYKNWIGPYQIAEFILFWMKTEEDGSKNDKVHAFGKWLATDKNGNDSWLSKICTWIDSKKKRNIKVRIDPEDTWSMDSTLAYVVLPMLKQLKETKHGSPWVDDVDVPEDIRSDKAARTENGNWDDNVHARWNWVMNEMIFAFETTNSDWEEQFWKTKPELDMKEYPEDDGQLTVPMRWKVEGECDWDGRQKLQGRITNGFRLFGKYYQDLWD